MNEKIKKLLKQADIEYSSHYQYWCAFDKDLERFAELVRQDEREACAKLCEKVHDDYTHDRTQDGYDWPDGYNCAEAIRARSNRTKTSRDICGND